MFGWLLDGRPPLPGRRESEAPIQYGPGVRKGAAIGTALMCVLYFWLGPWRYEQDLTAEMSLVLGLLFCSPLAVPGSKTTAGGRRVALDAASGRLRAERPAWLGGGTVSSLHCVRQSAIMPS